MQPHATNELHIEGHHFPANGMSADLDIGTAETAAGVFDDGEGFGDQGFELTL